MLNKSSSFTQTWIAGWVTSIPNNAKQVFQFDSYRRVCSVAVTEVVDYAVTQRMMECLQEQ
jgi:hypothetical protein